MAQEFTPTVFKILQELESRLHVIVEEITQATESNISKTLRLAATTSTRVASILEATEQLCIGYHEATAQDSANAKFLSIANWAKAEAQRCQKEVRLIDTLLDCPTLAKSASSDLQLIGIESAKLSITRAAPVLVKVRALLNTIGIRKEKTEGGNVCG